MTQVYALEQQLNELTQGADKISEFFTKMKSMWDAMSDANPLPQCTCLKCTCHLEQRVHQMQETQRMIQFMMKLNDDYSVVRANILMQVPMPNVTSAYRLFAQEERHKEIAQIKNQSDSLAFYSDSRRFNGGKNIKAAGVNTQNGFNYPKPAGNFVKKPNSQYYCTHYKIAGHSNDRCFKLHGYPPNFKGFKDRKVVANVAAQSDDSSHTTADQNCPITVSQYNQLMGLLQKQQISGANNDPVNHSSHALLAGPFTEVASEASW
ncbi:uncharacterized protein LOC141675067 [Apium graveolens]|uniref:uncharacterized protein LOC141675067 n=1 Tax=Apium graveolens TaxID=4045 RepID=UPI003D7AC43E